MLPKEFRGYLDYLEKNGKLLRVKKEVDPKFEIAAGIRKISDTDGPALLFENIKGHPGWRVAGGVFATRKLMAFALETEPDERKMVQRIVDCDQQRVKPKLVKTGPVKEIIIKGEDVDLTKMPIPTHSEKDSGPYFSGGVDIAKHPETGVQNISIHRGLLIDRYKRALLGPVPQHIGYICAAAERKGKGAQIATVLGAPPEMAIASQLKTQLGVDNIEVAGALRGEPIEVVKCETIDVEVPANAEVIIEQEAIPGERAMDGPFGEYPGDYIAMTGTPGMQTWVLRVKAITMRKNPIFQTMLTGMPVTENHVLRKYPTVAVCYRMIAHLAPPGDIRGIHITDNGICNAIVSIRKTTHSQPKDIIRTLLSARLYLWNVIVVDDDVDPYDPNDVERAWATRVKPKEDIIIIEAGSGASTLLAERRWGIDATAPLGERDWATKAVPPGVDKVDYV